MTEPEFLGTPNALWAEVFSKFAAIARMKPWKWFHEHHSFAIHPDGYMEPFFVHPCKGRYSCECGLIIVYGWNADALFCRLVAGGDALHAATRSYEMPIVLCALKKWNELSQLEQLTVKTFGEPHVEGDDNPVFVSFRPGWMPWHLSKVEVESTAKVLNQALGVLLRAEDNISLIEQKLPVNIWVRRRDEEHSSWEEGWTTRIPFTEPGTGRSLSIPEKTIQKVLALPQTMAPISIDFDIVPRLAILSGEAVTVKGEDGRLPLGYLFAIQQFGDAQEGQTVPVLETGVFYPGSDIGALFRFFPDVLVKFFIKRKCRPAEIIVSNGRMRDILRPLQLLVPFKIIFHGNLPEYAKILTMIKSAVNIEMKRTGVRIKRDKEKRSKETEDGGTSKD